MRNLNALDQYRVPGPGGERGDHTCGAFLIPYPLTGVLLKVLASADAGWDHVSVSLSDRTPSWAEMSFIHRTFFKENEAAWEYHVPTDQHINIHPHVLHLWRKWYFKMPLPPRAFV